MIMIDESISFFSVVEKALVFMVGLCHCLIIVRHLLVMKLG